MAVLAQRIERGQPLGELPLVVRVDVRQARDAVPRRVLREPAPLDGRAQRALREVQAARGLVRDLHALAFAEEHHRVIADDVAAADQEPLRRRILTAPSAARGRQHYQYNEGPDRVGHSLAAVAGRRLYRD